MNTPTATIFLPWHALDDAIQRGTRAAQPDAADVVPGTLYGVTDEGDVVERSNGTAWEAYRPTGGGGGAPSAHHPTHEPGGSDALVNAAWTNLANMFTQDQTINSDSASLFLTSPLFPANARKWQLIAQGDLLIQAVTDADVAVPTFAKFYRSGQLTVNGNLLTKDMTANGNITATGLLTVNGFGTHTVSASGSGVHGLTVRNLSAGSGNSTEVGALNDAGYGIYLQATSSTYAATGLYVPDGAVLLANGSAGLSVSVSHASGTIRFYTSGATERLQIAASGHIGCGAAPDSDPTLGSSLLTLAAGSGGGVTARSSTNGYPAVGGIHTVNASAAFSAYFFNAGAGNGQSLNNSGAWSAVSDRRLKTDIRALDVLDRLRLIQPRDFRWRSQDTSDRPHQRQFGFIAQEVADVFPDLVTPALDGTLGIAYTGLIAPLVQGWQDHDARLAALEARIAHAE
jgi:hypothetical protein